MAKRKTTTKWYQWMRWDESCSKWGMKHQTSHWMRKGMLRSCLWCCFPCYMNPWVCKTKYHTTNMKKRSNGAEKKHSAGRNAWCIRTFGWNWILSWSASVVWNGTRTRMTMMLRLLCRSYTAMSLSKDPSNYTGDNNKRYLGSHTEKLLANAMIPSATKKGSNPLHASCCSIHQF